MSEVRSLKGVNEETGGEARTAIDITRESWRCGSLVRVTVWNDGKCESIYLRAKVAIDVGHAIASAGYEAPDDDACEPWDHSAPLPGGEWLDEVTRELEDPRAASVGHKSTIGACRLLVDELRRMRAGNR
jgi:hypothetical protein